ncbi:MAG TPA: MFS transporter [Acidimicrobiales bacterium]|nr:MFS transporter [Acidimicrobiales bacterium]
MPSTLVERAPDTPDRRPQARSRAVVLAVILATYLMIVLDVTVIVTALPRIRLALGFSATGLSWVQNAYTLTFGGFLLLGARAGDLLGRRRVFVAGIALFTLASLLGGLASCAAWLLAARAVQGIGGAVAAPSALALLQTTFPEGPERTRAIAAYSAVAGGGGSVGLVLGGVLTSWASWRWGLFLNVPIGVALSLLAPRVLPETARRSGHFDIAGACTSTLGMVALVYGFVRAAGSGWGDPLTVASFAASAVLLAAFVRTELRAEQPITPLRLFASPVRAGAYAARVLLVSGMFAMFFFVTQFLQGVLHYSPIEAGLAFLPVTLVMFGTVRIVPRMARTDVDPRLLGVGVVLALAGMAWLSRLTATTPYFPGIAVPMTLLGLGIGTAMTPLTNAGIAGVAPEDAGAASGLVNVSQQVGSSLGVSILVTVFASASRTVGRHASGLTAVGRLHQELARGVAAALSGSTVFLAVALLVVVAVVTRLRSGRLRPSAVVVAGPRAETDGPRVTAAWDDDEPGAA